MKKKIFALSALAVGIICSFAFNKPSTIKDVPCGEGKFWFIYNGATAVQEDSNLPAQQTAAKNQASYIRLTNLTQCSGEILYCAICASPSGSNPNQPNLATGTTERAEIDKYVLSSQTHDPAVIKEKPNN
jgi:hypothetical protein